jgi:hypothetical protein
MEIVRVELKDEGQTCTKIIQRAISIKPPNLNSASGRNAAGSDSNPTPEKTAANSVSSWVGCQQGSRCQSPEG